MISAANLRVPEGSKLIYTNDDRRKSKLIVTLAADPDYQAFRAARIRLAETAAAQRAAIEKNRSLHQAKLLTLQYYGHLPGVCGAGKEKLRQPLKVVGVKITAELTWSEIAAAPAGV